MGAMGYGYGSECHLLRWMGRHRRAFDAAVCAVLNKADGPIDWLDLQFKPNNPWPDKELKGLEFIDDVGVRKYWASCWPTSGNNQNWDAVGWWGEPAGKQPVLVEAKANLPEIYSDCKAKSQTSCTQIEKRLREAAAKLGVVDVSNWKNRNYQLANRLAVLHILHERGYHAHLLLLYFVGDRQFPSRPAPSTVGDWAQPLTTQKTEMGLPANHALSPFIHELFLHVCEQQAWSRPDAASRIDLSAGRAE